MDEFYKRSIRKAYHHQIKKLRTQEEQKQLREHVRSRRSEERTSKRPRREGWDDDEEAGFERMRTARERKPVALTRAAPPEEATAATPAPADGERALVLSVARARVTVQLGGERLELPLAPALAAAQQGALAVGDEVAVELRGGAPWRVSGVLPRRSALLRPRPGDPSRPLALAANVDLAAVVVPAGLAAEKRGLVDRLLIALERGGVGALLCLNKVDLLSDASASAGVDRAEVHEAFGVYRELGYETLFTSAATGEGIAALRAALAGRTCVFVGQSGVGKSSLLNALDPERARVVREVRAWDHRGRHTTSASELVELADGTRLVDTPGVRAFGLWGVGRAELEAAFPELAQAAPGCRFGDCTHVHEPDCAVQAAVAEGRLSRARYDSYARILASLDG